MDNWKRNGLDTEKDSGSSGRALCPAGGTGVLVFSNCQRRGFGILSSGRDSSRLMDLPPLKMTYWMVMTAVSFSSDFVARMLWFGT